MEAASQAADQVVRLSLEGVEYAVKLSGKAAVRIAALLLAAGRLANENAKSKGAQRMITMIKSGKQLTVFSLPEQSLKTFAHEAKRYGITYCALRDKETADGAVDLLVRAEDAPKINRIVERYDLVQVDAQIETEEQPEQEEREENPTPGRETPPGESRDGEMQQAGTDSIGREIPSQNGYESTGTGLSSDRPSVLEQAKKQPTMIRMIKSDVDAVFRLALSDPKLHAALQDKNYIVDSNTTHTLLDTHVYSELRERGGYEVTERNGDIIVREPESGVYVGLGRSFGEGYSRDGMWNRLCGEFRRRDDKASPAVSRTPEAPIPKAPSVSGPEFPEVKPR